MTDLTCKRKRKWLYTCSIECVSKLVYICICGYVYVYIYVVIIPACACLCMYTCKLARVFVGLIHMGILVGHNVATLFIERKSIFVTNAIKLTRYLSSFHVVA
jgi:hypothetical protein